MLCYTRTLGKFTIIVEKQRAQALQCLCISRSSDELERRIHTHFIFQRPISIQQLLLIIRFLLEPLARDIR